MFQAHEARYLSSGGSEALALQPVSHAPEKGELLLMAIRKRRNGKGQRKRRRTGRRKKEKIVKTRRWKGKGGEREGR